MRPVRLRTIIEELRFAAELKSLVRAKTPRVEDFVEGLKWLLARNPQDGKQIGSSNVWFIANEYLRHRNELPVVVYYTFDEDYVNLMSINESVYPPNEE